MGYPSAWRTSRRRPSGGGRPASAKRLARNASISGNAESSRTSRGRSSMRVVASAAALTDLRKFGQLVATRLTRRPERVGSSPRLTKSRNCCSRSPFQLSQISSRRSKSRFAASPPSRAERSASSRLETYRTGHSRLSASRLYSMTRRLLPQPGFPEWYRTAGLPGRSRRVRKAASSCSRPTKPARSRRYPPSPIVSKRRRRGTVSFSRFQ